MAETKILEREYVIPLRRVWLRVPAYRRAGKSAKAIKEFIAKHMKVDDRNTDKVKLDIYLNNEIWFRGRRNPPSRIKVKAIKEEGIVKVELSEMPKHVKFLKAKHSKLSKKTGKEPEAVKQEKEEQKTEEQKTDEKEKEKAVEEMNIKQAEQQAKAEKHITKVKEPRIQRMALKK